MASLTRHTCGIPNKTHLSHKSLDPPVTWLTTHTCRITNKTTSCRIANKPHPNSTTATHTQSSNQKAWSKSITGDDENETQIYVIYLELALRSISFCILPVLSSPHHPQQNRTLSYCKWYLVKLFFYHKSCVLPKYEWLKILILLGTRSL